MPLFNERFSSVCKNYMYAEKVTAYILYMVNHPCDGCKT